MSPTTASYYIYRASTSYWVMYTRGSAMRLPRFPFAMRALTELSLSLSLVPIPSPRPPLPSCLLNAVKRGDFPLADGSLDRKKKASGRGRGGMARKEVPERFEGGVPRSCSDGVLCS